MKKDLLEDAPRLQPNAANWNPDMRFANLLGLGGLSEKAKKIPEAAKKLALAATSAIRRPRVAAVPFLELLAAEPALDEVAQAEADQLAVAEERQRGAAIFVQGVRTNRINLALAIYQTDIGTDAACALITAAALDVSLVAGASKALTGESRLTDRMERLKQLGAIPAA